MSGKPLDLLAKLRGEVDPLHKHIILVKLDALLQNAPSIRPGLVLAGGSPERMWLAAVGALLRRLDPLRLGNECDVAIQLVSINGAQQTVATVQGLAADAVEQIKLDLELDGRSEIGTTYEPGEIYRYFADLKKIIAEAKSEIFIVDPYFNGTAFNEYLSSVPAGTKIKILADKYTDDIAVYAGKHAVQFKTAIEIRRSNEPHDRVIFVDGVDCWISGGSIKDGGKKPTYLIPVHPEIAAAKRKIYDDVWNRATVVFESL